MVTICHIRLTHTLYLFLCCYSVTLLCPTHCNPMDCSMLGLPVHHLLLEFAKVHIHCISDTIQPSHPLMPSKYWNFSFQHQSFSEYSGLISLKIDWFDLLAVQGTFRNLLQNHSSKASILWCSAFFTVLASCDHWEDHTIALTIQTFVGRVMSQLFNTLSRFVIYFLPRNNHLLFSWLQSPSAV